MADDLGRSRVAAGLRIIDLAGERADGRAGQAGAIRRGQRGPVLATEVIAHHVFVTVLRQHQIQTGSLVVAAEQQLGVRNDNRVGPVVSGEALRMNIHGNRSPLRRKASLNCQTIQNRTFRRNSKDHHKVNQIRPLILQL